MAQAKKIKQLMKILVATAWIDGVIQPEEREYLKKKVAEHQLENDVEIKSLLSEIKPVTIQECYQWLENYLGKNPTNQDYQKLLEEISALVYSDGDIDIQEAKLLSRLQEFEPSNSHSKAFIDQFLKSIRQLYTKAISNS